MRYFSGLLVALGLIGSATAGELDDEFQGGTRPAAADPAAQVTEGSELDQETPAQACHRRWRWGGWYTPRYAFSYYPRFSYAYYPRVSFSLGWYGGYSPLWSYGYRHWGHYGHWGHFQPWGCYW